MKDTSGNGRRRLFFQHFTLACFLAWLLLGPAAALAKPRPPLPPLPESGVIYYQSFDGFHPLASGDAWAVVPGLGNLVESWSGYALVRSGTSVVPWMVPAVDAASGRTNLSCDGAGGDPVLFRAAFFQRVASRRHGAGSNGPSG